MSIFRWFYSKDSIKRKILDIKVDLKKIVRKKCRERVWVMWHGAYYIDPKHLAYIAIVRSDAMKDKLNSDVELNKAMRELMIKHDYPKEAIPEVYMGFESDETIKRDSGGDYWLHFK